MSGPQTTDEEFKLIEYHLYVALGMLGLRYGIDASTSPIQHIKAALKDLKNKADGDWLHD